MRNKSLCRLIQKPSLTGGLFPYLLVVIWLVALGTGPVSAYEVRLVTKLQRLPLPGDAITAQRAGDTSYLLIRQKNTTVLYRLQGRKLKPIRRTGTIVEISPMGNDLRAVAADETLRLNGTRIIRRIRHQVDQTRTDHVRSWYPLRRGGVLLYCNGETLNRDDFVRLRHAPREDLRYLKTVDSPLPADGPLLFSSPDDRCLFFARDRGAVRLRAYYPREGIGHAVSDAGIQPAGAALSPDGSTVLVADRDRNRMRLVQVDTGQVTDLPLEAGDHPSWSPAGDGFILLYNEPAGSRLVLANLRGKARVITDRADAIAPFWADNQRLGWFENQGRDLVLLTLPAGDQ